VFADLAAAVADGADCVDGVGQLWGDREHALGQVASMTTLWRCVDKRLDASRLPGIRAARAHARERAWAVGAAPNHDGWLHLDVDATITIDHSDTKENAAATWKHVRLPPDGYDSASTQHGTGPTRSPPPGPASVPPSPSRKTPTRPGERPHRPQESPPTSDTGQLVIPAGDNRLHKPATTGSVQPGQAARKIEANGGYGQTDGRTSVGIRPCNRYE
jgi:hypothetical protein